MSYNFDVLVSKIRIFLKSINREEIKSLSRESFAEAIEINPSYIRSEHKKVLARILYQEFGVTYEKIAELLAMSMRDIHKAVMDQIRNCLSYEDFIDIIDSSRIIAKKQVMNKIQASSQTRLKHYIFIGKILNKILRKLVKLELRIKNPANYIISDDEKAWAIDFLSYILRVRPEFCIDLFDNHDVKEIKKFIRNKVYSALLSEIPRSLLFDEEDIKLQKRYEEFMKNIRKVKDYYVLKILSREYKLPINHFEMPVFFHKLGIEYLPQKVVDKLEGKDFIDGGAYIGDSAIVLQEYNPRRIYAFEPLSENYDLLLETIKLNNLSQIVVPIKKALGLRKESKHIVSLKSASFISDIFDQDVGQTIEVISIDEFVNEKDLEIGLIKLDVEGYELDTILGAEKTIKRFKPIMVVSLYHRGQDFFEIPKIIKNFIPEYRFRFLNLNAGVAFFERVLLAYVEGSS
jgi:FkbM family methyltransferase